MIKTYIAALLGVLMAGTQFVQAQESMDDVFAQLDAANESGSVESAPAAAVEVAPVETAAADAVDVAPAAVDSSAAVVSPDAVGVESDLFIRGVEYYRAGDYDQAEKVFETMLAIDPYDTRAMNFLKRTAQRISFLEAKKLSPTRDQAMRDVNAAWNPVPKMLVAGPDSTETTADDPNALAIQQMEARIKGIKIPSLDFRDANIKDVVLFLSETCRRLDAEGQGVNMLLLGMDDSLESEENNITISIRDMSLYEALQYIVEMAALKFEVKPGVVAIMPVGYAPASELVLRSYDVSPDVGVDLESAAGSDDGGGADDLFGDSFAAESTSGPVDVVGFFTIVDFPEGSSAVYQPRFQKLFVKNTPRNLKAVEEVLADLEDEATRKRSQQVEIEAKFVEFNEGALEELGFDWTMYGSGSALGLEMDGGQYMQAGSGYALPGTAVAGAGGGGPIYTDPVSGQQAIADPKGENRPGQNVLGSSYRDNGSAFADITTGVLRSMGGTPAAMVFGNDEVDIRITAMEQEGTADVLSAPKVTTKSGNEAIIRVAEVHRYPQDWDVETGQRTSPVVKPQDWEDFDLGVTLRVTPVVDSDSNTIDLDLNPEITKFKGFDEYKVGANAYESSGSELGGAGTILGDGSALVVKMPYFEKRSVQTMVTIADGHTVLMGGLVDERTETFRDQVPFLGDIPYLGRLFRTEGSRSAKKNLVIYVKATQVDDRGMTQADRELVRLTAAN